MLQDQDDTADHFSSSVKEVMNDPTPEIRNISDLLKRLPCFTRDSVTRP